MKLAVAVLSSILLACSVTIANPIDPSATTDVETSTSTVIPSATTDVEASTSSTPNPNGIGLGALDYPLPDSIKELLEKYEKKRQNRNEQKKKCELLRFQYDNQDARVADLERKIYILKHKYQGNGGSSEYDNEIQETKSNLETQKAKLADLGKDYHECVLEKNSLEFEMSRIEVKLVECVFGEPWDPKSFDQQLSLIDKHPSVRGYFSELRGKGQSSGHSKRPSQKPSDQQQRKKSGGRRKHRNPSGQQQRKKPSGQQQRKKPSGQQQQQKPSDQQPQEPQPSSSRPSGSGSLGRRVSSSIHRASSGVRRGTSRLVGNVESFFKRPKDEDREPLIEH
ncbi:hypothetical protein O5D80_003256 [Batrachochytrium dendrobatidis]|nr:hypothetical protein O5D80_003256 [Batrachochytrium dendrobatidis]